MNEYTSHGFVALATPDAHWALAYTTVDDPFAVTGTAATAGVGTKVTGINANGDIVGSYNGADLSFHGFVYSQGVYTTLDDPLAASGVYKGTQISGIDNGKIVGSYVLADGTQRGFLYEDNSFTTLSDPSADGGSTTATGISGDFVVGSFTDANHVSHGFIYRDRVYTTVDDPLAAGGDTHLNGILGNTIVGDYAAPGEQTHGMYGTFAVGPSISGIGPGGASILDIDTVKPLSSVQFADDVNPNNMMTVTVALSDPSNGYLSYTGVGSYDAPNGVYTVSGSLDAVRLAVESLMFTPYVKPTPTTTTFTVTLSDGVLPSVKDSTATVTAEWIDGGGHTISLGLDTPNAVALHGTAGVWDTVQGTRATIYVTNAQVSVVGTLNSIWLESAPFNVVSLYQTGGLWDAVYGSGGAIYLTSSQTSVTGAGDSVWFAGGTGNSASLYQTGAGWDAVYGSGGSLVLNSAQAAVVGDADTIYFSSQPGNTASLYATDGQWDFVYGSAGTVILTDAQAAISGGGDTIWCGQGADNLASLSNTAGDWDTVFGAQALVILDAAQASVVGGGDAVRLSAGSTASLYNTSGVADVVKGSGATLILNGAQAKLTGSSDWVYVSGDSTLTLQGASETLAFAAALGQASVSGFSATDTLRLSASDWASYAAFQASHALQQHGADAVITFGAGSITLVGVQASSLTAAQFAFV